MATNMHIMSLEAQQNPGSPSKFTFTLGLANEHETNIVLWAVLDSIDREELDTAVDTYFDDNDLVLTEN